MILYFADRRFNILEQASTALPEGLVIIDDLKTEDVDTGTSSFECKILFTSDSMKKVKESAKVGNFILRSHNGENEFFTIIDSEENRKDGEYYVYAEDAGLDLLNEIVDSYAPSEAQPISHYIDKFAFDSGFEIGINEIAELTRKLSWDGEDTATARLASVATQFGAELDFGFEVKGLRVVKKYINIYKQRGQDAGVQLRLNREINNIITTQSIENVATALHVTGGTPENAENPITLNGYNYDDGDFFLDGTYLKTRKGNEVWSRYLSEEGDYTGYICKKFSYDTTSQSELCNRAIAKLKELREIEVNYEVEINELPDNVKIGDRVNIIDDAGGLYVSARILVLETSVANNKQKAVLGEYLIRNSGISQKVAEMAQKFEELSKSRSYYTWTAYADDVNGTGISLESEGKMYLGTAVNRLAEEVDISDPSVFSWAKIKGEAGMDGEDAVTLRIDSSRGTVFKNNMVSTVLSVVIYKGSERISNIEALHKVFGANAYLEWSWQRMDEERFGVILSTDSRIGDNGFTFTLSPDDVDTKVVFMCKLITD